ncbi:MAG: DUF447 family protein [Planctomycetia bacterium]|nr:DUF447 family protein [Planctomycetia bacterium]
MPARPSSFGSLKPTCGASRSSNARNAGSASLPVTKWMRWPEYEAAVMPSVYAPQRRRSDRSTGVGSPPIPASLPAAATVILDDTSSQRARLSAEVVASHSHRPFRGFNRAAHAVVEAAILFSRLHLLGAAEVQRQLTLLRPLIDKTASDREHRAFELIATGCGG